MKKRLCRLLAGCGLCMLLVFSNLTTAFAFYNYPENKKGVLTSDVNMIGDVVELGCKQVIFTMLSSWADNPQQLNALDAMLQQMDRNDLTITAVVVNDFQPGNPIIPVTEPVANYYQFNTLTPEGIQATERAAAILAYRYRNLISNWIIGNEIQSQYPWNYLGVDDMETYAKAYSDGFRIFYQTIKSVNPEARVFTSYDYTWNVPESSQLFPGRELLQAVNRYLSDTDYGIAWHPYPQDLKNPDYLNASPNAEDKYDTGIVNMKNLQVLTAVMEQPEMLSPEGSVRHLLLSEQGFSSGMGEELQAQSIALAYMSAASNPYVEGFLINRLVDAPSEVAQGYSFGLYTSQGSEANPTGRKPAWYVYQMLN